MGAKVVERNKISEKDKWDLSKMFSSTDDWFKEAEKINKLLQSAPFDRFKTTLCDSPDIFLEFVTLQEQIERRISTLYMFAHLTHCTEMQHDLGNMLMEQASILTIRYNTSVSWVKNSILSASTKDIDAIKKHPLTKVYTIAIDNILRFKPHVLSNQEELLLAKSSKMMDAPYKYHSVLSNVDIKFDDVEDDKGRKHPLTRGTYTTYIRDTDRTLRKNAFIGLMSTMSGFDNSYAEMLISQMKCVSFSAEVRKFASPLHASLFNKNVPMGVYTNVISAARQNIPFLSKCIQYKQKCLGYKQMNEWDILAPIATERPLVIDYAKSVDLIMQSIQVLGEEYCDTAYKGMTQNRWVDKFENINKQSGAFSSGCYDSPPYILMNFHESVSDLYTLTHELGHSMHTWLSNSSQPFPYHDYTTLEAEVASNVNESLLRFFMIRSDNERYQRAAKQMYIEESLSAFFRQSLFAEFELWVSEEEFSNRGLSCKKIKDKYKQLNEEYYGASVTLSEFTEFGWQSIPHFYYDFYVHQYAIGFCAGLSIAKRLLDGSLPKDRYLHMLKSGCSCDPVSLLKIVDIDLLSPDFIIEALEFTAQEIGF